MNSWVNVAFASCVVFALTRATDVFGHSASPPARSALSAPDLIRGGVADFVDMSAFTPAAGAASPTRLVSGRLVLGERVAGVFHVRKNDPFDIPIDDAIQSLPAFNFEFVQDGNAVIPVQRGPVQSEHPNWEYVLEPGLAWNEPGDGGYTRVAIPFALQERNANCLHNGIMSFVFGDAGAISDVFYEIASETCAYFKFETWGLRKATFAPGTSPDAAQIVAGFRAEEAARLPVRPIADLIVAHPRLSADGFALKAPADGDSPTLFGIVVDGINYVGGCQTRMGTYPFCDVLALPSYSTAKTVVGAVGLMRLEKLLPGARNALISDYVPECANRDWRAVTFENALDMTTGVYRDTGFEADENSKEVFPFYQHETHAQRIDFACRHYRHKAPPGTHWVYRTTDTYVLGTAMAAYARRRLSQTDFYDELLVAPLWKTLHLSPVLDTTRRTRDPVRQPLTGYGLTYHRDDIARLAHFLSSDKGAIGGEAMLDQTMLNEALQRDAAHRGMAAGYPGYVYQHGVWARDIAPLIGCPQAVWIPYMAGYGGNLVVMLPNGVEYYYFSDSWGWDWGPAALEINKLRPLCQ